MGIAIRTERAQFGDLRWQERQDFAEVTDDRVPGAGREGAGSLKWLPVYKKIQVKDKLLQILDPPPCYEIEPLMRELDPRKRTLSLGAESEDKAGDLLPKAELWARI